MQYISLLLPKKRRDRLIMRDALIFARLAIDIAY